MFTFRPTAEKFADKFAVKCAGKFARKLPLAVGAATALLGITASSALATESSGSGDSVPAVVKADLAVCPGQTFAQTFAELGDLSYYTQVPGPTAEATEGWELSNGASVVSTTLPDGSEGTVIDVPSGAVAVSPPTCVTLQYPTARVFTNSLSGTLPVQVTVVYAAVAKNVARVGGNPDPGWALSQSFQVKPQLGGKVEEAREVRFIFTGGGKHADTQIYGLFVDPRMV